MIDWSKLRSELTRMVEIIDMKDGDSEYLWWQTLVHDQRDKLLPLLGAVASTPPPASKPTYNNSDFSPQIGDRVQCANVEFVVGGISEDGSIIWPKQGDRGEDWANTGCSYLISRYTEGHGSVEEDLRKHLDTATDLGTCAASWEEGARLLGNVKAIDIYELCMHFIENKGTGREES